jgi:hypothetical protein
MNNGAMHYFRGARLPPRERHTHTHKSLTCIQLAYPTTELSWNITPIARARYRNVHIMGCFIVAKSKKKKCSLHDEFYLNGTRDWEGRTVNEIVKWPKWLSSRIDRYDALWCFVGVAPKSYISAKQFALESALISLRSLLPIRPLARF